MKKRHPTYNVEFGDLSGHPRSCDETVHGCSADLDDILFCLDDENFQWRESCMIGTQGMPSELLRDELPPRPYCASRIRRMSRGQRERFARDEAYRWASMGW